MMLSMLSLSMSAMTSRIKSQTPPLKTHQKRQIKVFRLQINRFIKQKVKKIAAVSGPSDARAAAMAHRLCGRTYYTRSATAQLLKPGARMNTTQLHE